MEYETPAEAFGFGFEAGGFNECSELGVGDGGSVDVEGVKVSFADGAFAVGGESFAVFGSHEERAAVQFDHAFDGAGAHNAAINA